MVIARGKAPSAGPRREISAHKRPISLGNFANGGVVQGTAGRMPMSVSRRVRPCGWRCWRGAGRGNSQGSSALRARATPPGCSADRSQCTGLMRPAAGLSASADLPTHRGHRRPLDEVVHSNHGSQPRGRGRPDRVEAGGYGAGGRRTSKACASGLATTTTATESGGRGGMRWSVRLRYLPGGGGESDWA